MTLDTAVGRDGDTNAAAGAAPRAKPAPKPAARPRPAAPPYSANPKAWWLRQLRTWHWISSAVCLVGILLFTITGITLNHAGQIEADPSVDTREAVLPDAMLDVLAEGPEAGDAPVPAALGTWLRQEMGVDARGEAEWSEYELYIAFPRPGGDAWLSIDRETGDALYESTSRGAVAYLNDLHKGRNTGLGWRVFIDAFAVACLAFCLTGLALLYLYARGRRSTWPLVAAGLGVPLLIALIFIH